MKLVLRCWIAGFFLSLPGLAAEQRPPNVIFILVDDMGWMDSSAYGSRYYDTPNIDRLAAEGMRFTDAYAHTVCSPTRASILTGKYPARLGITTNYRAQFDAAGTDKKLLDPKSLEALPLQEYTVAERLRDAGYRTAHIGKWHLGRDPEHGPGEQGFEVALYGTTGPRSYFAPYGFSAATFPEGRPGEYLTDRLTEEALKFIDANRQRPFFLNLWHYAVHSPWGYKPELAEPYKVKQDPRHRQGNPVMAAMLRSLDESLGRILDKLDEHQLADDTLLVFFSDNGGNVHRRIGPAKLPPTDNAPLRDGKGSLYEGGLRVPLLIRWPGVVRPGSLATEPVGSIDLYPTILDALHLDPRPGQVLDGESLVPLLQQTGRLDREVLFNFHPHGGAARPAGVVARQGNWKLIRRFETNDRFPDRYELYDLEADLGETENLAADRPALVTTLSQRIDRHLAETGAEVPRPNPEYRTPPDPMDGWVVTGYRATVSDGVLRVESAGDPSFLAVDLRRRLQYSGPLTLLLKTRSGAGGEGRIRWRTATQPAFDERRAATFSVPGGDRWQELAVRLPVEGKAEHLQMFLPASETPVQVDWIELQPAKMSYPVPLLRWSFADR